MTLFEISPAGNTKQIDTGSILADPGVLTRSS